LECRLVRGDRLVDLGVCIERGGFSGLPEDSWNASWRRTMAHWIFAPRYPWTHVPRILAEFDRPHPSAKERPWDRAFPFLSVEDVLSADANRHSVLAVLGAFLSVLTDEASELGDSAARDLVATLPQGARILHAAALDHRGAVETR